jgi:cation-transporting ATPase 13A1
LKKLSSERPIKTIRNWYFIISIVGQTVLHLYGMHYAVYEIGLKYTPEKHLKVTNDEEFVPTFLNTVVFLFSMVSQTSIFLFNHAGEPHMEGLAKNKRYLKFLIIPLFVSVFLVFNLFPEISDMAELYFKEVPYEANLDLAKVLGIVIVGNYVLERGLKFMKYRKFYEFI